LINDIIEFDQKLTTLPTHLQANQHQLNKHYWNIIFSSASLYYITLTFLCLYLWPLHKTDIAVVVVYLVPMIGFVVDFTVVVSSHFYLQNLEYRFELLNDFWKCLPAGLLDVTDECSHHDIAMMVDTIRLLHSELSDILRVFSMGYGQMLLCYFVLNYINLLANLFYTICFKFARPAEDSQMMKIFMKESVQFIFYLQTIIFTMSIVTAASRVHDKVNKIQIFELLIIIINYNCLYYALHFFIITVIYHR